MTTTRATAINQTASISPLDTVLEALHYEGPRNRKQYQCLCPAHEDRNPSLSVSIGDDGRILLHCFAGCELGAILRAVGLTESDLFPTNINGNPTPAKAKAKPRIVATYDYKDAQGKPIFQVVRYEPKDFRQRRPDGNGGWIWNLQGVETVLYRLPELLAADPARPVFLVEGEKDADRLAALGLIVTTSPGGAKKWKPSYSDALAGHTVYILPDNDEPGRKHAQAIAGQLVGMAAQVKIVFLPDLPPKGDVSDWLDAGGTLAQLRELVDTTPDYSPNADTGGMGRETGKIWTTAELLAHEFPEPRWAVHGLLPAGLTFLAGRPKMGKSWLALQLAIAVATGGKFLERDATQGRVLYLALEDSERRIQDRLNQQHAPAQADIDWRFEWEHLTGQGLIDLIEAVEERDYALIIIDTFSRALGRADQMDLADMSMATGALQRLALNKDLALVLVDHHRKSAGMAGDVIDDIMGSTSKGAATDTAIGIYRERGKKGATLKATGRDVDDIELAITFDAELFCWQCEGDAAGVRADTIQAEILLALQELGGTSTISKIARWLNKTPPNIAREMNELVTKCRVARGARQGKEVPYSLVDYQTNDN